MPLDETLPIARQICDALEAAHSEGIVHRDLKPANIKLRSDGTVKVLDFGLARQGGGATAADNDLANSPTITSPAVTQAGAILGTAAYMAPEQAKGRPVNKRADIWAFGCVLYEMLTGTRLFGGEDVSEVLAAVLRQDIDWKPLPVSTPAGVRWLLQRCLERDPKLRLRDIGDARLLLSTELDEPPRLPTRSGSITWIVGAVTAAVVAVAAGMAWTRSGWPADAAPSLRIVEVVTPPVRHSPRSRPMD